MAANTILLDFSVDPKQVKGEPQLSVLSSNIENILRDYLANLKLMSTFSVDGDLYKLYTSDMGTVSNVRIHNNGLITINIEYYKGEKQEPLLTFDLCKELSRNMSERLDGVNSSQAFVPIKRGLFHRYFVTSDDRLLEYDIDIVVFEERSPYQKVQIVHSKSMGNILVLDDLQNISEADLIYTETLMQRGKENYENKEIVILGGGDGALLYELLKEKPKNVIMLEIDETVMKCCAKHMRSVCGDVLDRKTGPNYQIIVGDCMKSLELFIKEGRKFDYVFGDLTDIPITDDPNSEMWNFILKVISMSFKILKPEGKFMTHGNGSCSEEALKTYETQLTKLQPPVKFTKTTAFVPSFLEDWVFYQIMSAKKQ